jgi:hypothetical protein
MKDAATKKINDQVEFHVAVRRQDGIGYRWVKISATPIEIKGWEDFEFMYHESLEWMHNDGKMVITERDCGCRVGSGNTKSECTKSALANLKTVTKDQFRAKIKEMKKLVRGKKK